MNKEILSSRIKFSDPTYRIGASQLSEEELNQLENNLRRIAPENDYFNQKLILPSLCKGRVDVFLEKLLPDTRIIITPKIDGCAAALKYENGTLKKAISRKGRDITNAIKTVKNIPQNISARSTFFVRGVLFCRCVQPSESQKLAAELLRQITHNGQGLSFCAFQILNSELNYFSNLQVLEKIGFEIPETEFTNYTSDIEQYLVFWKEGKIFTKYPTDGIVLSVNSRKLQKQLINRHITSWQYTIKD